MQQHNQTPFPPTPIASSRSLRTFGALALLSLSAPQVLAAPLQNCTLFVENTSITSTGLQSNQDSAESDVSDDGRWVVFESAATNLVVGNTEAIPDVYLFDRENKSISLVSTGSNGPGDGRSEAPRISGNGRYVVFESQASNLSSAKVTGTYDVFRFDRITGNVVMVSTNATGDGSNNQCRMPSISDDGRYVAFHSNATNFGFATNGWLTIYVKDMQTGTVERASVPENGVNIPNGHSQDAEISGDGAYVAFESTSPLLVGDDFNGQEDIFRYSIATGTTEVVSRTPGFPIGTWVQGNNRSVNPSISRDGQRVAFQTLSTNLGGFDANNSWDVYLHDFQQQSTELMSRTTSGSPTTGNSSALDPSLSPDGNHIAFASASTNFTANDNNPASVQDIFVKDLSQGTIRIANVVTLSGDQQQSGTAALPQLSENGQVTVFQSAWSGHVVTDTNNRRDVFAFTEDCSLPLPYCSAKVGSIGCEPTIGFTGVPRSDFTGNFHILCTDVMGQKAGLLFYGLDGAASLPFQGGTLCVQPPLKRGPLQFSGGNSPNNCTGFFDLFMDAYASGFLGGNPLPQLGQAGETIHTQWWGRDPGFATPNNTQLSNALEYTVQP